MPRPAAWRSAIGSRPDATKSVLVRLIWQKKTLPSRVVGRTTYIDLDDLDFLLDSILAEGDRPALNGPLAGKSTTVVMSA